MNQADINAKKTPEIRKIYNPSDEEKDTIRFVYDRKRAMEDSEMRTKAAKTWDKSMEQWEAMRKEKRTDEWQSNHYVPLTQAAVETALSEFTGQTPRPFIMPRGQEDVPKVTVMQNMFNYSLECSDFDANEYDVMKEGLIKGTGIAQEYYWQEKRIIQEMTMGENKKEKFTEKEVIDYDDMYMENVRLEDFFVDEFARGFTGPYAARDCIRRYIMNIEDVPVMFSGKTWDPFDNVKNGYVKAGGNIDFYEYYRPPQGMDTSKQVEVLWYWATKPKDWLIIVANDVLIKKSPNPYKHKKLPFVRAIAVKRPHSFYGKGLGEVLESTQDETNVIRRMTIDRSHLDIDKMFFVSSRLTLNEEDLIARPHGSIPVDDVNGSKAIEYGDTPRSVEIALKHLEDDATISSGINPRAQALPQAGTATEASILKESTLKRLQLMLWLLKYEFLIPFARLRISNILQFYSQPKLEKVLGEEGTQEFEAQKQKLQVKGVLVMQDDVAYQAKYRDVRMENKAIDFDVTGNPKEVPAQGITFFEAMPKYFMPVSSSGYDVKFMAGSTLQISKPLMQTKMLELSDRVMQVALTVPGSYDPVKVMDKVIESYDINPNGLKPDQEIQSDQDQRIQILIQLAGMENEQMMKGIAVPPLEYSNPAHTRIHLEFMNSEEFQQLPNESPVIENFTNHVTGELAAQMARQQAGGVSGGTGGTTQTSVSQGMTNRPNGMAKPTTKIGNVLPALQTGGNKQLT